MKLNPFIYGVTPVMNPSQLKQDNLAIIVQYVYKLMFFNITIDRPRDNWTDCRLVIFWMKIPVPHWLIRQLIFKKASKLRKSTTLYKQYQQPDLPSSDD